MATIKDVAARAGVSQSTVHYALNGKRSISEAVRQRVMAAVAELDYTASTLGQRMREGRSYSIGLIAPHMPSSDGSAMEMLVSTAATASQADHTLGIFMGQSPEQVLRLLRNQFVDGLILVETTHMDPRIEALRQTDYPFVMIGRTHNLEGLSTVDFDFEAATFAAFENLVKLGHRTIGFIGPYSTADLNVENWFFIQRGFERARATLDVEFVQERARLTAEEGFRATESLLEKNPGITAIFAPGHAHHGVMRALYTRRMHVPEDCSVIGITTAGVAEWTVPKLTSVDIPLFEMGRIGASLLLRKLAGETVTDQILMPASVVVRESTAPPPAPGSKVRGRVSTVTRR
jgi:DNA-binding LacI/PurR family transcriptional regulator